MNEETKHAAALEIAVGITDFEVIRKAYLKQMRKYHPDNFREESQRKDAEIIAVRANLAHDFFKKKFNK